MSRLNTWLIGVTVVVALSVALDAVDGPSWIAFLIGALVFVGLRARRGAAGGGDEPVDSSMAIDDGRAEVNRMRAVAERLPRVEGREKVEAVCATADRVIDALSRTGDAKGALALLEHYLEPASAFLTQYERLAGRGLATTEPALIKAETRDLPLLSANLRELEIRLQRGENVDIESGAAALDFDLASAELPQRRRAGG